MRKRNYKTSEKSGLIREQYIYDHTSDRSQCIMCKRHLKGSLTGDLRSHLLLLHPKVLDDIETRLSASESAIHSRFGEGNCRDVRKQYIYDFKTDRSRCIICNRNLKGRHIGNLRNHLLCCHPIVLEDINTRWGAPKSSSHSRSGEGNCRDVQKQYIYDHTRNRSQCIICKRHLKGNNTGSLRAHLSRIHPKVLEDINTRWGARKSSSDSRFVSKEGEISERSRAVREQYIYDLKSDRSQCIICKRHLKGRFTGDLRRHLSSRHPIVLEDINTRWSAFESASDSRFGEEESSGETNDTIMSTASAPMELNNSVLSEIKIEEEQVTSSSLGADALQTRNPSLSLNEFADVGATSGYLRSGSLQNRDPPPNSNEFAAFGDYVGATIGRLRNERAKIAVKHLINNILFKAESGEYDGGILQTVGEEDPIDTSTVKSETIAAPT